MERTASQPTSGTSRAHVTRRISTGALALAFALVAQASFADEGGVSFWLPGFFGSLAAAPLQPGWSLQSTYYHTSVSAGADVSRAREITIGKIPQIAPRRIDKRAAASLSEHALAEYSRLAHNYPRLSALGGERLPDIGL